MDVFYFFIFIVYQKIYGCLLLFNETLFTMPRLFLAITLEMLRDYDLVLLRKILTGIEIRELEVCFD